jgi:hypothetical protein
VSTEILRTTMTVVLWLVVAATFTYCALVIDLEHNVISWHPQGITPDTTEALAIYGAALAVLVWLARRTRLTAPTILMWLKPQRVSS